MIAFSKLNVFTPARKVMGRFALPPHPIRWMTAESPIRESPGKNRKIVLDFIGPWLASDRRELLN